MDHDHTRPSLHRLTIPDGYTGRHQAHVLLRTLDMQLSPKFPRLLLPLTLGLLCFAVDASAQDADETFDRASAKSVLDSVSVAQCKLKKGPVGEGHVVVTYLPNGRARDAVVDRGPFVGTKAEKCIAKAYKKTSVPPFKGDAVSVGKTFRID